MDENYNYGLDVHQTLLDINDHIAELQLALGEKEEAMKLFERSYKVRKTQPPNDNLLLCLSNLTQIYLELEYFDDSKRIANEFMKYESLMGIKDE